MFKITVFSGVQVDPYFSGKMTHLINQYRCLSRPIDFLLLDHRRPRWKQTYSNTTYKQLK